MAGNCLTEGAVPMDEGLEKNMPEQQEETPSGSMTISFRNKQEDLMTAIEVSRNDFPNAWISRGMAYASSLHRSRNLRADRPEKGKSEIYSPLCGTGAGKYCYSRCQRIFL